MSRFRQPFSWEPQPEALPVSESAWCPPVVLPPRAGRAAGAPLASGEFSGARDTRAQLERQILDHTDGIPAAREWAANKARVACDRWDRGARDGSIRRHQ